MTGFVVRHLLCTGLVAVFMALPACEEPNDLGKYCFVGAAADFDAGIWDMPDPWHNPGCLSGLCLKQAGYRCDDGSAMCQEPGSQLKIQPFCTRACETSAGCGGASDNVNDCQAYVCQRSDPFGGPPVPCHCVCLDYIRDGDGVALTQAAFDASDLSCSP